jgi:hypothetical protein
LPSQLTYELGFGNRLIEVPLFLDFSLLHWLGGIAAVDRPGFQGLTGNATKAENRTCADGDPWANNGFGGDPTAGLDVDAAEAEVEGGFAPVVVAGAKVNALGKANVIFENDGGKVINPEVFAEPAVVTDRQAPGEFDAHAGFDTAAVAEGGTKAAQQPDFKGREGEEVAREEGGTEEVPEELLPEGSTRGIVGAGLVVGQLHPGSVDIHILWTDKTWTFPKLIKALSNMTFSLLLNVQF